jgi:hypothetical protein
MTTKNTTRTTNFGASLSASISVLRSRPLAIFSQNINNDVFPQILTSRTDEKPYIV